ncbi:MAG: VCBS domain-containing protein, partial [Rubripirellula sp.]|nr:VCBS domain-containing protein [Rubripirellula sp.]
GATSQATITITVSGTNDGPVAQAGVNTAVEDGTVVTGQLTETDADASDTHSYALITNTSEGSATVNTDGSYFFDPGSDFQDLAVGETREVAFVYEVTDNNGATSQATITITVSGTNDGPVAQAGVNSAVEDGTVVTGQLTEADADTSDTHTYTLITNTAVGSATVNADGSYSFDPGSDFQDLAVGESRDVTFVFEVTDNHGATSQAAITLTVSGTNDGPVAVEDVGSLTEDEIRGFDVLANDVDADANDTLAIAAVELVGGFGDVSIVNNRIEYRPDQRYQELAPGETAPVSIRYTVGDSEGTSSIGELQVTVYGQRDAMILGVPEIHGIEDATHAWPITLDAVDIQGETVVELRVSGLPVGTLLSDSSHHHALITDSSAAIDVHQWNLAGLVISPPEHFSGVLDAKIELITSHSEAVDQTVDVQLHFSAVTDSAQLLVSDALGTQGSFIKLQVAANLLDTDGSETLALHVSRIPVGATLTDGVNRFVGGAKTSSADVTDWDWGKLGIIPSPGSASKFVLQIKAIATELETLQQSALTSDLSVTVAERIFISTETRDASPTDDRKGSFEDVGQEANRGTTADPTSGNNPTVVSFDMNPRQTARGESTEESDEGPADWRGLDEQSIDDLDFRIESELLSVRREQDGQWKELNAVDFENVSWEANLLQNQEAESAIESQSQVNQELVSTFDFQPSEESSQTAQKASFGMLWALMRSWSGIADMAGPQSVETARRGREQET